MKSGPSTETNTMIGSPAFAITIDDVDMAQHGLSVENIMVELSLDTFGNFAIVLIGDAGAPGSYDWINDGLFTVGKRVSIEMGRTSNRLKTILEADITIVKATFPSEGVPYVELIGDDSVSPTKTRNRQARTISMRYGGDLLSFSPVIDLDSMIAMDIMDDLSKIALSTLSTAKNDKRKAAKHALDHGKIDVIVGVGECVGSSDVVPGRTLMLEGLGTRFSRQYLVTGSIHTIDKSLGYRTAFSVSTR
ncbi:MAG TPA: hypothetical protein VGK23_00780 [Methanomassiliicoccales archaeon]|jgi:hypothetical protein